MYRIPIYLFIYVFVDTFIKGWEYQCWDLLSNPVFKTVHSNVVCVKFLHTISSLLSLLTNWKYICNRKDDSDFQSRIIVLLYTYIDNFFLCLSTLCPSIRKYVPYTRLYALNFSNILANRIFKIWFQFTLKQVFICKECCTNVCEFLLIFTVYCNQ